MPVPASKVSTSHGRRRRSHDALKVQTFVACAQCQEPIKSHHACPTCGTYRGRKVLDMGKSTKQLIKKSKSKSKAKAGETPKN